MNKIITDHSALIIQDNQNSESHTHQVYIDGKRYDTDRYYEQYNETRINLGFHILSQLGINIVLRELKDLDINIEEFNNLINSNSEEDYKLAISILESKSAKYSIDILNNIKYMDDWRLNYTIEAFDYNNKLNLGKIK